MTTIKPAQLKPAKEMLDYPPKNDRVFKRFFGNARELEELKAFLQSVLDLPQEDYDEIHIEDPHLLGGHPEDKRSVLDVSVKTKLVLDAGVPVRFFVPGIVALPVGGV